MRLLDPRYVLRLALLAAGAGATLAFGQPLRRSAGGWEPFAPVQADRVLSQAEWARVDESVDRGLAFIASQQAGDGSFPATVGGQPGVTSLCVMAFLSCGQRPGEGPYGERLERAIDFVLSCQEASGLIAQDQRRYSGMVWERRPHTATYNHAISGLMLGEAYGQVGGERGVVLKMAIERALVWARQMHERPPRYPEDIGGWRYLHPAEPSKPLSDLSATGWFVMFYRSARNADFDVPEAHVRKAAAYAARCFDRRSGGFYYGAHRRDHTVTRGMTGAGLLISAVAGDRDKAVAQRAGRWLLDHPFNAYGAHVGGHDRFHYGAYYCSQAMYLLGGEYWANFYPELATTLIVSQRADGGWPPESRYSDSQFGRSYSTALSVLALTPPYQMLPIYQR